MLSENLTDGFNRYKIDQKIRNLRLDKKLALIELADPIGLSTAMLSGSSAARRLVSVVRKGWRIKLSVQVRSATYWGHGFPTAS